MFFELDKAEQGDWFPFFDSHFDQATGEIAYDPPEEGAAEFCIRSMIPFFEESRKGRKKESKMVLNTATKAMERVSYYPDPSGEEEQKEFDDLWDFVITGIRNAFSDEGKTIPITCTRENKLKLIKLPKFLRFIKRVFQIIDGEAVKTKEQKIKNS
jgi:hypothetical protein